MLDLFLSNQIKIVSDAVTIGLFSTKQLTTHFTCRLVKILFLIVFISHIVFWRMASFSRYLCFKVSTKDTSYANVGLCGLENNVSYLDMFLNGTAQHLELLLLMVVFSWITWPYLEKRISCFAFNIWSLFKFYKFFDKQWWFLMDKA